MQRCIAFLILSIQVWVHRQKIIQSHLTLGVACPVQGRAVPVVFEVDVHPTHLVEVVKRECLIALCGNVQDSGAELVPLVDIGLRIVNQEFDQSVVAVIGREVQGCELFIGGGIRPVCQDFAFFIEILQTFQILIEGVIKQEHEDFLEVLIARVSQDREQTRIFHLDKVDLSLSPPPVGQYGLEVRYVIE